jgi:acyl-CoA dehydrogenase
MDPSMHEERADIRKGVRALCREFPDAYWREVDRHEQYPKARSSTR